MVDYLVLQKENLLMNPNKLYRYSIIFLAVFGFIQLFTFSTKVTENILANQEFYAAKAHTIESDYDFCGEKVPVDSKDIKERLDREILKNSYWHSEMLIYYKRIGKYFPIIEPILKANNIPNDFKYLAIIESGLSNAVSPAGARGFWQIMEKTGKEFGLEVNKEVDERYHLVKATEAACRYLNASYKRFGSWTLVAASYNLGMGGVSKRLKQQNVNNYYDLLLNSETARYVFRIVAIKDILTKPSKYGFNLEKKHRYEVDRYTEVEYDSTISNLTEFAIQNNINYKILKLGNPWLRRKKLTNSKRKNYVFKILETDYKIQSSYSCYNRSDSTTFSDSLNSILCNDSISSLKIPVDSAKNSIISDTSLKNTEIERIKK